MTADEHLQSRGLRALLPPGDWATLAQAGLRRSYVRGQALLRQGDPGTWVLLLIRGRTKIVYSAADGSHVLLAIRGQGDLLGEFALQDDGPRSASAIALEPCLASLLTAGAFAEFTSRNARSAAVSSYVMTKIRESSSQTWAMATHRPAARLAHVLLRVVDAAGSGHPCPAEIPMSQEELAGGLGLARSSVTPVLAEWKRLGLIEIGRSRLRILDAAPLRAIAGPR